MFHFNSNILLSMWEKEKILMWEYKYCANNVIFVFNVEDTF